MNKVSKYALTEVFFFCFPREVLQTIRKVNRKCAASAQICLRFWHSEAIPSEMVVLGQQLFLHHEAITQREAWKFTELITAIEQIPQEAVLAVKRLRNCPCPLIADLLFMFGLQQRIHTHYYKCDLSDTFEMWATVRKSILYLSSN